LAVGCTFAGHPEQALVELAAFPDPDPDPPVEHFDPLVGRGHLREWTDELDGARADLAAVVSAWRRAPFQLGLIALGGLSEVEYRLGAWDAAVGDAERGLSTARDAGQVAVLAPFHSAAAYPYAGRGEWEAAEGHIRAAREVAQLTGDPVALAYSATAAALLASARGDHEGVLEAVEPLPTLPSRDGTYEPGYVPWREVYTDALVALGRLDEAEAELASFEAVAAARHRRSSMANAARVRGRLEATRGRPEQAEQAFRRALALAETLPIPFDRALSELAYGAFLRRAGRRKDAAQLLNNAAERLSALRARPYLQRCEEELAACGLAVAPRREPERDRLTPQEHAVARLVAQGLTNRQVAADLVVSVKTVEYHLSHCYAKLGVSSRAQLAARWGKLAA